MWTPRAELELVDKIPSHRHKVLHGRIVLCQVQTRKEQLPMEGRGPLLISESIKLVQDEHVNTKMALAKVKQARKDIQGYCSKGRRPRLSLNSTPLKKRGWDFVLFCFCFLFQGLGGANEKALEGCLLIGFSRRKINFSYL